MFLREGHLLQRLDHRCGAEQARQLGPPQHREHGMTSRVQPGATQGTAYRQPHYPLPVGRCAQSVTFKSFTKPCFPFLPHSRTWLLVSPPGKCCSSLGSRVALRHVARCWEVLQLPPTFPGLAKGYTANTWALAMELMEVGQPVVLTN